MNDFRGFEMIGMHPIFLFEGVEIHNKTVLHYDIFLKINDNEQLS
jgi:hypothetical protein